MSSKEKIGLCFVVLNVAGYTAIEINGAVDHLQHAEWDPHANFHAVSGLLWLLTLFVVNLILLWHFARRREAWMLWTVAFIGVGVFGGAVGSEPLSGGG